MPVAANLIYGDPRQPCCGVGLCALKATAFRGTQDELSIPVSLDTVPDAAGNFNLVITIDPAALASLKAINSAIWLDLVNNNRFKPWDDALPFYMDANITDQLWPDDTDAIIPAGAMFAVDSIGGDPVANGLTITVDTIGFGTPPPPPGHVFQTPTYIRIGEWTIRTDTYGNLVFSSTGNSTIKFGINGSVMVNARQVVTDRT